MNHVPAFSESMPSLERRLAEVRGQARTDLLGHPAVKAIMAGHDFIPTYIHYLCNVFHYASHSPIVIGMAGARAVGTSPGVGKYLLHHATEEIGHEAWAESDLKNLGQRAEDIRRSRPSPSCSAMIGMEYYWAAHANPVALLGWMYSLEGFGDDIGHLVASRVDAQLGPDRDGSYFLHGHGDADHAHIVDITRIIASEVAPADLEDVFFVADLSRHYYLGMLTEAFATANQPVVSAHR